MLALFPCPAANAKVAEKHAHMRLRSHNFYTEWFTAELPVIESAIAGAIQDAGEGKRAGKVTLIKDRKPCAPKEVIGVRLKTESYEALKERAAEERRPVTQLIRNILADYVAERRAHDLHQ